MKRVLRVGMLFATVFLLGGCQLLLAELATDFSLTVVTEQLEVAPGDSGNVTVRIDQTIPVDVVPVPILVTLHQPPDGVTAEDLTIPSGITEDDLIVQVDSPAAEGVYDITIRAKNDVKTRESTFELTIASP